MKKILLSILITGMVVSANSQQLQSSSLYDMQGILHNSSMVGAYQRDMFGVTYRSQWAGISGNPKTATVFGAFDVTEHKIGLGGYIYSDKTGPTSRTGVQLAFAKYIPMKNDGRLSFGIELRGLQYGIDVEKLSSSLGNDPVLASSDNKFKFDAGFGISYTDKKWELGASVAQLIQSKLDFYTGSMTPTEEGRLYRYFYFHGAYKWAVDKSTVITPNFLVTYLPNAPTDIMGGVRVEHSELFWWGVGYRKSQSFILSAGVHIQKKLTAGYAFDIYNAPSSVFEKGGNAHEVLLRYNLGK